MPDTLSEINFAGKLFMALGYDQVKSRINRILPSEVNLDTAHYDGHNNILIHLTNGDSFTITVKKELKTQ